MLLKTEIAGQNVSREIWDKLTLYRALLDKWQNAFNLVSASTLPQAWERHFADSAQLLPHIPDDAKVLADLGSGAGFPGMVLAILHPELEVHLIESDEKKSQFLRTVSRETQTPVIIHNSRIENMVSQVQPDVVTARALAHLSQLLEYCLPWAANNPEMVMLFLKGEQAADEVATAKGRFKFNYKTLPSLTITETPTEKKAASKPAKKSGKKAPAKNQSTGKGGSILRIHHLIPLA
jgi:16S rRNA (guanine527-N7)-methyltransferase